VTDTIEYNRKLKWLTKAERAEFVDLGSLQNVVKPKDYFQIAIWRLVVAFLTGVTLGGWIVWLVRK